MVIMICFIICQLSFPHQTENTQRADEKKKKRQLAV